MPFADPWLLSSFCRPLPPPTFHCSYLVHLCGDFDRWYARQWDSAVEGSSTHPLGNSSGRSGGGARRDDAHGSSFLDHPPAEEASQGPCVQQVLVGPQTLAGAVPGMGGLHITTGGCGNTISPVTVQTDQVLPSEFCCGHCRPCFSWEDLPPEVRLRAKVATVLLEPLSLSPRSMWMLHLSQAVLLSLHLLLGLREWPLCPPRGPRDGICRPKAG